MRYKFNAVRAKQAGVLPAYETWAKAYNINLYQPFEGESKDKSSSLLTIFVPDNSFKKFSPAFVHKSVFDLYVEDIPLEDYL